jgi:hypothetical protein
VALRLSTLPPLLSSAVRLKKTKGPTVAREDLNSLLDTLFTMAQQLIENQGEFYPFGATMTVAGEIVQVAAYTGDEHPTDQELIELLVGAFRAQAANKVVRAVGLCLYVRTIAPGQKEKTDAVCARLRHADGESVDVFLPYQKDESGAILFGELFAWHGEQDIFG